MTTLSISPTRTYTRVFINKYYDHYVIRWCGSDSIAIRVERQPLFSVYRIRGIYIVQNLTNIPVYACNDIAELELYIKELTGQKLEGVEKWFGNNE